MTNKLQYILLLSISMLLYNCNTKGSNQQATLDTEQIIKKTDATILDVTSKTIHPTVTDTTNYLTDCFYKHLTNGEQSFKAIESALIEQDILKSREPKGYKELFIKFVKPAEFSNYNSISIHNGNKMYFEDKLKIATILKTHIKYAEDLDDQLNQCYEIQSKKKGFEKSQIKTFINKNNELTRQLIDGTIDKKYPNHTLYEVLNKEYSSTLFVNIDPKLINYLLLYKTLKEYDEEQMNIDYVDALEAIEQFKKDANQEESTSISTKQEPDPNRIEVIEMTDEDVEEFTKNGGVLEPTETAPDE